MRPQPREEAASTSSSASSAPPSSPPGRTTLAGLGLGLGAGLAAWLAAVPPSLASTFSEGHAALDDVDPDMFSDSRLSFTAVLVLALALYWGAKAMEYLSGKGLDGDDALPGKGGKKSKDGLEDHGASNAPVRTFIDGKAHPELGGQDAQEQRNASLAKSAAYRVATLTRESQPRIHGLLVQLLGTSHAKDAPRPSSADVDPVAELVWQRVLAERQAKGIDVALGPRELEAVEQQLLEQVAESCAAEQVAQLKALASSGKLWAEDGKDGSNGGGGSSGSGKGKGSTPKETAGRR